MIKGYMILPMVVAPLFSKSYLFIRTWKTVYLWCVCVCVCVTCGDGGGGGALLLDAC